MSQTYNQIIERNRLFVEAHFKLKGFGNGFFYDVIEKDKVSSFKYPLMYMEDVPSPQSPGVETFVFRAHFMAPVAQNAQKTENEIALNLNEIKSDMRQCSNDFKAFWIQDKDFPTLTIEKVSTATFFEDETDDRLTGCYIDVTFKQPFTYNICAVPMANVPPPPVAGCDPATETFNGNSITAIPSGGNKDIIVQNDAGTPVQTGIVLTDTDSSLIIEVPAVGVPALDTSGIYVTGQTISNNTNDDGDLKRGSGVDYFNTTFTNPFGNSKSMTGITGGYFDEITLDYKDKDGVVTTEALAFPDKLILNWMGYNVVEGKVFMMSYDFLRTGTSQSMILAAPYTVGSFSGLTVVNWRELTSYANYGIENDWFNWAPLNYSPGGSVLERILSSTRVGTTTYIVYVQNSISNALSQTNSNTVFIGRYVTLTELGL